MEKLIIENRTDKSMVEIIPYINQVVKAGRVSAFGKQYCYAAIFEDNICVSSFRNKNSDRLVVSNYNV